MGTTSRIRALVAAVAAFLLTATGLTAAGAAETSITLSLDHASPFMAGEVVEFEIHAEGFDDGEIVILEAYDHYIDTWVPRDYLNIQAGHAEGSFTADYLHDYEAYSMRATIGSLSSEPVDVNIVLLETSVTGDASVPAGTSATLELHAPVAWDGGLANLYVKTTSGWTRVRTDVPIVDGIATVEVTPKLATRYLFSVLDETGTWEFYDSPQFVVDVVYSTMTITPNTPDPIDGTFIKGQSVTSTFGWGHRGTSDTVTLQWGKRVGSGVAWTAVDTKKSLNGYASFTWKPSAGHVYRYKVVRGGVASYSPTFVLQRTFKIAVTAPKYATPGVPFKVAVSATGWSTADAYITTDVVDGIHTTITYKGAWMGKSTATVKLPKDAFVGASYGELPLPGEWLEPAGVRKDVVTVAREFKLYQSKTFEPGSSVSLAARVGDGSDGAGAIYARPVGTSTWYRIGTADFVDGVARFSVSPNGTREVKVVLDGQSTNVIRLTQS
jgi:hypothetical protein